MRERYSSILDGLAILSTLHWRIVHHLVVVVVVGGRDLLTTRAQDGEGSRYGERGRGDLVHTL